MPDATYWDRVASLGYLESAVRDAAMLTALVGLPAVIADHEAEAIDWNHPLFAASLITPDAPSDLQDAALRIVQACVQDPAANEDQKDAARLLLQSWGNLRAIELAQSKSLLTREALEAPLPFQLDLVRREFELTIRSVVGSDIHANDFQRQFWDAASRSNWVSVSAPTSVGKSFIVRKWMEGEQFGRSDFTAIYVVPTRALIDEVSAELIAELGDSIDVFVLPWDSRIAQTTRRIFVFTQERLHLLLDRTPSLTADLLFIDEAQKFDDGRRGILLQRVLDEVVVRSPEVQVIFASPLATNPEVLLNRPPGTSESLLSEGVTVNQNLIYANQRFGHPLEWNAELAVRGEVRPLGTFTIPFRPTSNSKRLAYVAVALGGEAANVVYVNGAAEAEKVASNIYESLPSVAIDDPELASLIELVEKTIHSQYLLATTLRKGVAFHYGNMPLLVREEIERLFRVGSIRYLICTSTLLEGVNLPCQNIFVRGPRKGNKNPMAPADFWNLAGRAGRWGKEFQGTIVCVDTNQAGIWNSIPLRRERAPISRATDQVLGKFEALVEYIQNGATVEESRQDLELESTFSLLASLSNPVIDFRAARWLDLDPEKIDHLAAVVSQAMEAVSIPREMVSRHAGISPLSLQRLFEYFLGHTEPNRLPIAPPESNDAAITMVAAMSRIDEKLGGGFSSFGGRRWQLAILLVNWMRGRPLSVLISERANWVAENRPNQSLAATIRSVLEDVEQIARFQAPLYLTAYVDILRLAHPEFLPGDGAGPDLAMMLELGVSRTTELSMMSLGVSRTAAVALAEHVVEDSLNPTEFMEWLRTHDLDSLGLPVLVVREFAKLMDSRPMYE